LIISDVEIITWLRGKYGYFVVTKLSDITGKIIPFFQENEIVGVKLKDFQDWCKVVNLMKDKQHLTPSGLEKIKDIVSCMNKNRNF